MKINRTKSKGNVLALIGGQYGSEGKGVFVQHLADKYDAHVRIGGPNAGHSYFYKGKKFVNQSLPIGWVNPNAMVVIGAGAILSLPILEKELVQIREFGEELGLRLLIDLSAFILDDRHHHQEGGVQGELHNRIGSTGEGIGAVRLAKLHRDKSLVRQMRDVPRSELENDYPLVARHAIFGDTSEWLYNLHQRGGNILLEGTQGSGLSLTHGPWPFVTTNDTNAAQMAADAGISPRWVNQIVPVFRTFPIRVAGNSGPMAGETSWQEISAMIGKEVIERTTVTKKIRRVAKWDNDLFMRTVRLNAPTSMALSFVDYLSPADEGKAHYDELSETVHDFVRSLEKQAGCPMSLLGTGLNTVGEWQVVDRGIAL